MFLATMNENSLYFIYSFKNIMNIAVNIFRRQVDIQQFVFLVAEAMTVVFIQKY